MKSLVNILLFTLILVSCGKKLETPSWEMNLNAAVLYSDMGIEDIIPDSLLQVNPDNSVHLVYSSDFFNYGIDSLLKLPDSTLKDSFRAPINLVAPPGQILFNSTDNNAMSFGGPELVKAILKEGYIDYTITSNIADTVILTYEVTTATQGGLPLKIDVTVPPSTSGTVTVTGTHNLANADMDLTGALHNTVNAYQTKLVIKTGPGVTGVNIVAGTSKVTFRAKFRDLKPSYVKGYFGSFAETSPLETQTFDFIRSLNMTSVDLQQVNTSIYLKNGLGADARIKIDTFMAVNTANATEIQLTHPQIGQYITINRATDLGYAASPYIYTMDINSSNSNIESFIESLPDQLKYKMFLELNPMGNISAHSDFLYENSTVSAGLNIDIPLNLIASGINLADTLNFDLDSYDQNGKILKGKVKFNVVNGLPLTAQFKAIMLDENNMVIGNLIGPIDVAGNSTSSSTSAGANTYQTIVAELNEDNIYQAYRCKKIIISTSFATSPTSSFAYIYSTQRFKTQVAVQVDYLTQE